MAQMQISPHFETEQEEKDDGPNVDSYFLNLHKDSKVTGNIFEILNREKQRLEVVSSESNDSSELIESLESFTNKQCEANEHSDEITNFYFCHKCTKYKTITLREQIEEADSIRFPKLSGAYYHHAIVESVEFDAGDTNVVYLNLIHLHRDLLKAQVIRERRKLNIREDRIEKVTHDNILYTKAEILKRAKEALEKDNNPKMYNILRNNCEHIVNKITHGIIFSEQVYNGWEWFFDVLLKCGVYLIKVPGINQLAEVLNLLKIYYDLGDIKNLYDKGLLCLKCFNEERKRLIRSLIVHLIRLAVWFFSCFALYLHSIVSTAFKSVSKKSMRILDPVCDIAKKNITSADMIAKGDIITYKHMGSSDEAVITNVYKTEANDMYVKVSVVHFAWPGLTERRKVKEEIFYLKKGEFFRLDFGDKEPFSAKTVVDTAKARIGEKNYNFITNRSSHMSRKCKTGEATIKEVPKKAVQSIGDVNPGDVIEFDYMGFPHEGVVTKVDYAEDIRVQLVHYKYNTEEDDYEVVEEDVNLGLLQNIEVHDCTYVDVYEPNEVVKNARSKVGERKYNYLTNRSIHVARWCKVKE